jgi:hypothetical protein
MKPVIGTGATVLDAPDSSTEGHWLTERRMGGEKPRSGAAARDVSGRYWVRTSDLFGVNEALYH